MALDLDGELAELRAAARDSDAHHELIPDLKWPDGVRLAVNFTADFDAMLLRRLMNETPMQLAKGEFGGRVGIWRLIELFDRQNVTATIYTPGRICELYPDAVRAAARSGHEVADHMWEHRVPKEAELEDDHLSRATAALESLTGKRPVGTRSWHTTALLVKKGYIYNSHGSGAAGPFWEHDGKGSTILNLPFHYAIDDAMFYSFAWLGSDNPAQRITDTDRVMDLWWKAFERQYRTGGYLNICLHPFVSGRALRIAALEKLIQRMKERPGVWFPSCEQVARHVIANHPSKAKGVH